jgi:AraC-like DNA-binding protein
MVHLGAYLVVCWRYVMNIATGTRSLPWYRGIVVGVGLIWVLYMAGFVGVMPEYRLIAVFFCALIYILSYVLMKHPVFALEKYANSSIDPVASRLLLQQAKNLFEQQAVYLNSDISLKGVADSLSINARDLSQAINEHEGKNFSEFVNRYRIDKAMSMLADSRYEHEKIASIAYECGFGNVTSFNLAFKAVTQVTPSQYRERFTLF